MTRLLRSNKNSRAQLSLEYLLLLSAFFSALLLLMPLVQRSYSLALFGFDSRQAVSFSEEFSETVLQLSILADGSALSIDARPLHEWNIIARGKTLSVSLRSESLGKTKDIETSLATGVFFEKSFGEKTTIILKKNNGKLTIDSYP